MAAPILKIPVDDTAFKRFLDTFSKYQKELKDQPEIWKGMGAAASEFAEAGASFAESISKQTEETKQLAAEERKREDAKRKAESAADKSAREKKKLEDEEIKRREEAIQQVKRYASTVKDSLISVAKWGVGGGLFGMVTGGFGLGSLAGFAGDERRMAMGMGTSIGSRQRAQVSLGRYVDTNSAISKIAGMQVDPMQQAAFSAMHVAYKGRDPAKVLEDAAVAAGRLYNKYKGNPAIMEALGVSGIFGAEEQRTLGATYKTRELQHTIGNAPSLELSDKSAKAWQGFLSKLDEAGFKIKDALSDKLSVLARDNGPLSKLTDAFSYFVTKILTESNIDWLAKGIENFANTLNDPKFKKTFDDTIVTVGRLGGKLSWLIDLIPGQSGHATPPPAGVSGSPVLDAYGDLLHPGTGSTRLGTLLTATGLKNKFGQNIGHYVGYDEDKSRDVYATLMNKVYKWSASQTRGILSAGEAESKFDPLIWGDPDKKTGQMTAFGIHQLHKDRRDIFARLTGFRMENEKDPIKAAAEQAWFADWELGHTEKRSGDKLRKQMTAYGAGEAMIGFERPANEDARKRSLRNPSTISMMENWNTPQSVTIFNQTGNDLAFTSRAMAVGAGR